jgi:anti-sigma-K factor RskA
MNTQEYIASGILEQYAVGSVSAQEKQEVECLSHIYPEIQAELCALQQSMEQYAIAHSKNPPAHLRAKILSKINTPTTTPKSIENSKNIEAETPIITLPAANVKRVFSMYRYAAAALTVGLVSTLFFWMQQSQQTTALNTELATLKTAIQQEKTALSTASEALGVMNNPSYQKIVLKGIPEKSPDALATIYWSAASSTVFASVHNLPTPPSDKQYQLWVIADGKPVDMGMLDNDAKSTLQRMKITPTAQAFAVTLEKKGGVTAPTMTEMYVIGKI